MATVSVFQQIVPFWLTEPVSDPALAAGITQAAIIKGYANVRRWKMDLTATWAIENPGLGYSNAATLEIIGKDVPTLSAEPTDEVRVWIDDWGGFGILLADFQEKWTYLDGAQADYNDVECQVILLGPDYEWIAANPDRANLYSEEELQVRSYITFAAPEHGWHKESGISVIDDDSGIPQPEYTLALDWQSGEPGEDFYATMGGLLTASGDGYTVEGAFEVTIYPDEYWTFDGRYDSATGEPAA